MNSSDRTLQAINRAISVQQSENETLKYTLNYAPILNTLINASTWSGQGISITSEGDTDTTSFATLSASPGRYTAINLVTTTGGEVIERIINLHVTSNRINEVQGDYE